MPKILIIEDDEKLREELKIFLNKNGYNAITLTTFVISRKCVRLA